MSFLFEEDPPKKGEPGYLAGEIIVGLFAAFVVFCLFILFFSAK